MRKLALAVSVALFVAVAVIATAIAKNDNGGRNFHAKLHGLQEVPSNITKARGTFTARLKSSTELEYRLTYRDLEGGLTPNPGQTPGAIGQAHIHLGQRHTNGGIAVFLCGGSKPACPAPPATVTGTITGADIVGPAAQGLTTGEFADLIRAMRHRSTYVNLHTNLFPGGEIRGQILNGRHGRDDGRRDKGRGKGKDDDDDE